MSLLKSILAILRTTWFWSLVGVIVLSLVVWFFGDLVQIGQSRPLGQPLARLLVVLTIMAVWAVWNLLIALRRRRANDALVKALAEPTARPDPGATEVGELARRFGAALEQLKRSRVGAKGGRRWLYQLPWYVMIGPPGSGKTTALAQSGLRFPLGQAQDLRGVGGTRYCDWVFTDEAVLIDTAGRYTSQDSDASADGAAWLGFLDLLKKHRPRQPLNGVLVAISTRELLGSRPALTEHANRIRARLEEIEGRLGRRLPVYLLVTKADLVAGFSAFFGDLGDAERQQVWGATFAHEPGRPDQLDLAALQAELDELIARLDRRLPRRLSEEADLERRAQIFGFPARVAEIGQELRRFVELCFPPSTYEKGAWLRGVYFTSGTQTGTPIDRLMAAIASNVGVPAAPPMAITGDRSFFLTRLLQQVIFGEASLVGRDFGRERRERWVRTGAVAGLAALTVLAIGAWSWSFIGNRARQYEVEGLLAAWAQGAAPVAKERLLPSDYDYVAVIPLLDQMAAIGAKLATPDPLSLGFGLSQRATMAARVDGAYRNALVDLLLPRLVLTTERDLRARLEDPDYVMEALKVYLMLGGGAPVDPALVEAWYTLDAEGRAPNLQGSVQRHSMALAALVPTVEPRPSLDDRLLADARAVLSRIPLAKRAYESLISSLEVRELPGWKVTDNAGPNATLTLLRRSGQPLGVEVPAIYTYDGFHEVFLPLLDEAARAGYGEAWVLSGRSTPDPTEAEIEKLKADMLRLYYDDAIAEWDGLLRDVTLTPMTSLDKAVEATRALSGPNSPLKLMIQGIVRETALSVPPPTEAATPDPTKLAVKAAGKLNSKLGKLAKLVAGRRQNQGTPSETPGAPVEAHFAYLKALVEGVNGAPPALDEAIAALGSVHGLLQQAQVGGGGAGGTPTITAARELAKAAARLPPPLGGMLGGVAQTVQTGVVADVRQQLNAAWKGDVLPFCRKAIGGRFPFAQASAVDASLEDVVRLFGPAGLIQGFVKNELGAYVDTTRQPWRDQQGIGLSAGSLALLARAERIGTALLATGGAPKASFNLTPLMLDAAAASVTLDLDGQELRYAHGPARPTPIVWPGPGGSNTVRLSFAPVSGGIPVTIQKEGAWSLFRLLHEASFERTEQPDLFEITFAGGGHTARFRLRAASVENPFDLRILTGFACPEGL